MTQQTNAVAQQPKQMHPVIAFKNFLNSPKVVEEVAKRLGKNSADFTNSLIELVSGNAELQKCNPNKLMACALKAASLHLPLNPQLGKSYVITFNTKKKNPDGTPVLDANGKQVTEVTPTFVIGYKGYVQLAKNSGQYKTLNTGVVYEGMLNEDGFDYLTGEIRITGKPTSKKVVGFFAHAVEINGFTKTLYMSKEEMAHYAKTYSASLKFNSRITEETLLTKFDLHSERGPETGVGWLSDSLTMAKKVVLKQLLDKWGSLSIEAQKAMASDEVIEDNPEMERNNEADEDKKVFTEFEEVDTETGEIQRQETFPGDKAE